ncbi:MAG: hypothetical protein M1830_009986 [Pleopsidium flavum]|nr:MAG: hypothetical protein M1830_009986 [Pleopsidium flavum]
MSLLNSHDDEFRGENYIDYSTSHPVITRPWNIRPERNPSPTLSELYPEYYEPIEPGQKSPTHEPSSLDTANCGPDTVELNSKKSMLEDFDAAKDELHQQQFPLQHRAKTPNDGFDMFRTEVLPSDPEVIAQPSSSSVTSTAARLHPTAKHHCLISGHIFKHYRISRLPPEAEIDGLSPPSEHNKHKQEDLKVNCMICRRRIDEHLWKCEISVCLREVCGDCRRRLDQENVDNAKSRRNGRN